MFASTPAKFVAAFLVGASSMALPNNAMAGSLSCSDSYARQAIDYLVDELGNMPASIQCRWIDAGETETIYFTFSTNGENAVVAECDDDCSDLDLQVYCDGELVGRDITGNSFARVSLPRIDAGTTVAVEVTMYSCSTANCAAAIGTLD